VFLDSVFLELTLEALKALGLILVLVFCRAGRLVVNLFLATFALLRVLMIYLGVYLDDLLSDKSDGLSPCYEFVVLTGVPLYKLVFMVFFCAETAFPLDVWHLL